ncbi:MAG: hypothetical protein ABW088_11935 [Sedimenticola sp.]
MRNDNQHKRERLESSLEALLIKSFEEGSIEVANGRIHREWIRDSIGCGQNWPSQNEKAKELIKEYEGKLREQGLAISSRHSPGIKDKDVMLLMARLDRLEQRNVQLLEMNNHYKAKLYELGWLDSDDEESAQGRLPW